MNEREKERQRDGDGEGVGLTKKESRRERSPQSKAFGSDADGRAGVRAAKCSVLSAKIFLQMRSSEVVTDIVE